MDEIDHVLLSEPAFPPSAGFADAVRGAVRESLGEPPPVRFPRKRAIAGLASGLAVVAVGALVLWLAPGNVAWAAHPAFLEAARALAAGLLAVLLSALTARLPSLLARP